jgi:mycofactocin system transcriptional regulator
MDEGPRRGRPPGTSREALELIALRLYADHGYDGTTVDMIAAEAGTSRRTFFRYFESKASVLWYAFDAEVSKIRETLAAMPRDLPVMEAVRQAVVAVNHYGAQDLGQLRIRMGLIGSTSELAGSASLHYDAWERAVVDFVAERSGQPAESLYPLTVGRATLAACSAAYERWAARADADLTGYLDAALRALAAGFRDDVLTSEPDPPKTHKRRRP